MSKDPAFLFYPGDWLGGTIGMTFEEKGAYMELLMMQFNRGHMTTHMIGQVVGQLWVNLQGKFIQDENGLWYNERLEVEKELRKSFVESRKNNIKGENQYTKKTGHMTKHMTVHMEDENKDKGNNKKLYSEFDLLKLDELQKELKQQFSWIEIIQKNNNLSEKQVFEWIDKFISYQKECGEDGKTIKDGQSHFSRWIKIQLKNKPKEIIPASHKKLDYDEDRCPPERN